MAAEIEYGYSGAGRAELLEHLNYHGQRVTQNAAREELNEDDDNDDEEDLINENEEEDDQEDEEEEYGTQNEDDEDDDECDVMAENTENELESYIRNVNIDNSRIRARTAPLRPMEHVEQFKITPNFTNLEQAAVCAVQIV